MSPNEPASPQPAPTPPPPDNPRVIEWDGTKAGWEAACYRDTPLTPLAELDEWARDLAAKLARGENPIPTLRYIQHALSQEPRGAR